MAYGRFVKKVMRKGKRYAKKRYMRKGAGYGTGVRLNKLSQDIRLIKSSLNTEKKYADQQTVFSCAQVNGNSFGGMANWVTPAITPGTSGIAERVGNSIKLTGLAIKFQLMATDPNFRVSHGKFRFIIFEALDHDVTAIEALEDLLENNQITGLRDYNSERDLQQFKNFRIYCNKRFSIPNGNESGNAQYHQPTFMSRSFAMKMNHHIKYQHGTANQVSGKLFFAVLFDHGNQSSVTTSTNTNIPITDVDTGYKMNLVIRNWYVDN